MPPPILWPKMAIIKPITSIRLAMFLKLVQISTTISASLLASIGFTRIKGSIRIRKNASTASTSKLKTGQISHDNGLLTPPDVSQVGLSSPLMPLETVPSPGAFAQLASESLVNRKGTLLGTALPARLYVLYLQPPASNGMLSVPLNVPISVVSSSLNSKRRTVVGGLLLISSIHNTS